MNRNLSALTCLVSEADTHDERYHVVADPPKEIYI